MHSAAGATSFILVDLPAEEHPELKRVQLIAPTSTDERIRLAAERDRRLALRRHAHRHDRHPRPGLLAARGARRPRPPARAGDPLYAGFGISTPEQARLAAGLVDGVAVGSRAVQVAENGPGALRDYVASLRAALDA